MLEIREGHRLGPTWPPAAWFSIGGFGAAFCGSDLLRSAGARVRLREPTAVGLDGPPMKWSTRCCCHRFSEQSLSYYRFPSMLKRPVKDYAPKRELVMG